MKLFGTRTDRRTDPEPGETVGDPGQVALEARVEALESRTRLLLTEWEVVLDRVNRQIRTLGKKQRTLEALERDEEEQGTPQGMVMDERTKGAILARMRGTNGLPQR
jgi:hypothetical protein